MQAEAYAKSSVNKDYETVVKYSYGPFISMFGGKEKMVSMIKTTMESLTAKGITIESVTIGEPGKTYNTGTELHCLVPMKTFSKVPGGKQVLSSYLLAISGDKGISWTFLNLTGGGMNNDTITKLIPNFNQELRLPLITPAEFIKDQN